MLESRDEISIRKSFADELWSESFILSTCDGFYNSFLCNRFVINFVLKFLFLVNEKFFSYTRIREEIIPRIEVTFAEDCKLCYYSDSGQWFTRHVRWCATARDRWENVILVSKVFDWKEGKDRITQSWLTCWTWVNEGNLGQFHVRTVYIDTRT